MRLNEILIGLIAAIIVVGAGVAMVPLAFADRVLPGVVIEGHHLGGFTKAELPGVLEGYDNEFQSHKVAIVLRDKTVDYSLGDLGASVDVQATGDEISRLNWYEVLSGNGAIRPIVLIDHQQLNSIIQKDFSSIVTFPRNATLRLTTTGQFELISGKTGEGIDFVSFARDIGDCVRSRDWQTPIRLSVLTSPPEVQDNDVEGARQFATQLLSNGFQLTNGDSSWTIKQFTIKRLLSFVQVNEGATDKAVLGVSFNEDELVNYLTTTLAPEINQEARDARFSRVGEHVEQFSVPQQGRTLNIEASIQSITKAVMQGASSAALVVDTVDPNIKEVSDINALGIGQLITTGTTDFSGSPANRRHNIEVGVSRFHGLLVAPGQEFSFLEHLGPVDGEHGFAKELVIKSNVTVPEYGGGLCQVSTTLFRAAVQAGLEITQRRNHAYAVSYYGKPGFDATIYPPYTDFRFINNTPGYILIQARVDGNNVIFEFWGTDDGRIVEITGPTSYDRQPDGAVKATLTEHVVRSDGSVLLDKVFYSRYKSPSLFPHVVSADEPSTPVTNTPTNDNANTTEPTKAPAASATPNPT